MASYAGWDLGRTPHTRHHTHREITNKINEVTDLYHPPPGPITGHDFPLGQREPRKTRQNPDKSQPKALVNPNGDLDMSLWLGATKTKKYENESYFRGHTKTTLVFVVWPYENECFFGFRILFDARKDRCRKKDRALIVEKRTEHYENETEIGNLFSFSYDHKDGMA